MKEGLRQRLNELFCLPHIATRQESRKSDLALEIALLELQDGEFEALDLRELGGFPIFWRPKIKISSRLYNVETGKTVAAFKITEKMPWRAYLSRVFSINGFFRYKALFGVNDLQPLLFKACEKLLINMTKAI